MAVEAGITGAFAGAIFKIGAFEAGNGAPTAISHRCPGCPCAGFNLPPAIIGAAGLLIGLAEGLFEGAAGVDRVGIDAVLADSIRPPPSFSPQETITETQATITTVTLNLMVQALVPVKIHNNFNIAKRYAGAYRENGRKKQGLRKKNNTLP